MLAGGQGTYTPLPIYSIAAFGMKAPGVAEVVVSVIIDQYLQIAAMSWSLVHPVSPPAWRTR
jgi:hypothetical protein